MLEYRVATRLGEFSIQFREKSPWWKVFISLENKWRLLPSLYSDLFYMEFADIDEAKEEMEEQIERDKIVDTPWEPVDK